MALEVNGKTIEITATGYLVEISEWDKEVAEAIASTEDLTLTDKHWDVINYLRDEYINNAGNQPNDRNMNKAMSDVWGHKVSSKELYDLFPGKPSKQAGQVAGLPRSEEHTSELQSH